MKIVVGGTFGPLHDGHKALLEEAFKLGRGGEVMIGVTSDEMARVRNRPVPSYVARVENLRQFLDREYKDVAEISIVEINDAFGFTLTEDFDILVASEETYSMSMKINEEREKRGMSSIELKKVGFLPAEDGSPISSTRIKSGEIDKHGKLI
ncbi:MAG: phosphopantetheine adenylyltransferase [Halobacteriota archaeon]|nr:phosphopantetheine adenylyltransferase [Halobacteriota archaeon]